MTASVAAIAKGDYRGDGADQVVVCAVNGEVRPARLYILNVLTAVSHWVSYIVNIDVLP